MEPNTPKDASEYLPTLVGFLPLAVIGAIVALITSARKLYELPTKKRIAVELFITLFVGAAAALVAVGILPLIFGEITPKIEIGIAGLAGSFGQKSFDMLLSRLSGQQRRGSDRQD